ncbi:MAG: gamma-glutamyl-gamma-aminobutyrate hydrolase family protein [Clostridia bacterium]|nr:gamma-glutamyl-gamma-aminobutyrate hydrolase family protein [Clostridia bacterium]
MSKYRPLIGITSGYDYEKDTMFVKNGYYAAVIKAGGVAVAIPPVDDERVLDEVMCKCDGFILSGGPDLDAVHFNESNMPYNGEISPCRDRVELYIAGKAVESDLPLLGICRGIQVMNVALGGTIYQDIYSQINCRELVRHSQNAPKWYPTHEINIEQDTLISKIFGNTCARVNSFHHQAVRELGCGFAVTSRAEDGIIESIENTDKRFAVGIQWHAELMWEKDDKHLNLFREFIECCK